MATSTKNTSDLDLMQCRIGALYQHDERSRITLVNEQNARPAPRFYLARTNAGNLWRFRQDVSIELAQALEDLCLLEDTPSSPLPKYQAAYEQLLADAAPIESIWSGPAYWISEGVKPASTPIEINAANADLLQADLADWLTDIPHCHPLMVAVENGSAVSICASVRITAKAHEAGLETAPAYRRKGHAINVVAGWANAVRRMHAIPFYSTSWENAASQQVAARLNMNRYGIDYNIA